VPMSRIDDAVSRIFKMKFEVNYSKMYTIWKITQNLATGIHWCSL
jgi:hypothetical protein